MSAHEGNENGDSNGGGNKAGFFGGLVRDGGVQHAAAGVAVAILVAIAKRLIFGRAG
jgi:hypothetical protein